MRHSILPFFSRCLLPIAIAVACLASPASAQPAGAQGDDFLYRVARNDTLISLAEKYTTGAQNWQALQTLNNVADPRQLPIGLLLRIPFHMIPLLPGDATVAHVSGEAWLDQRPLQPGDSVAEGGSIRTGSNGFVTLGLRDGSAITIPSNASIAIQRLRVFKNAPLTDTILSVDNGSLESNVAPEKKGVGRFEVRTPVSITGVRGTRLRVHASTDGARSEVLEGAVQLDTEGKDSARLTNNQGAAIDSSGRLLGVSTLLPAPRLPAIDPADHSGSLSFPAVSGASSYLVRIAADPAGQQPLSSQITRTPVATYGRSASESYLMVRAIDEAGIGGHDAIISIPAGRVLVSSDGTPVRSGYAGTIQLTNY